MFEIASKFNLSNLDDLFFDDLDTNGLFYWKDGVEYINGKL